MRLINLHHVPTLTAGTTATVTVAAVTVVAVTAAAVTTVSVTMAVVSTVAGGMEERVFPVLHDLILAGTQELILIPHRLIPIPARLRLAPAGDTGLIPIPAHLRLILIGLIPIPALILILGLRLILIGLIPIPALILILGLRLIPIGLIPIPALILILGLRLILIGLIPIPAHLSLIPKLHGLILIPLLYTRMDQEEEKEEVIVMIY